MTERPKITINLHVEGALDVRVKDRQGEGYQVLHVKQADDSGFGQDVTVFVSDEHAAETADNLLAAAHELCRGVGQSLFGRPLLIANDHDLDECQERVKQASRK